MFVLLMIVMVVAYVILGTITCGILSGLGNDDEGSQIGGVLWPITWTIGIGMITITALGWLANATAEWIEDHT